MKYTTPEISDFGSIAGHTFGIVESSMRGLGFGQWSGGTNGPSSDSSGSSD